MYKIIYVLLGIVIIHFGINSQNQNPVPSYKSNQNCPDTTEEMLELVHEFLTQDDFEDQRHKMNIEDVSVKEIQPLVTKSDSTTCAYFNKFNEKKKEINNRELITAYFKTNNNYYILKYRTPLPPSKSKGTINISTASHAIVVYDKDFKSLGGVLL